MQWFPSFNECVSTALIACGSGVVIWLVKFFAPSWRKVSEAKAKKIEADADLSVAVRMNHERLCDMHERSIEMQSANTNAIGQLAAFASHTDKRIDAVYRHLLQGCACEADHPQQARLPANGG